MKYLLDTNIVSQMMRGEPGVLARWRQVRVADLLLSSIALGEGFTGAYRVASERLIQAWQRVANTYQVLPFQLPEAMAYARIRTDLERNGTVIGHRDCQIAATAQAWQEQHSAERITVVTHNLGEFTRVPGLRVEDWVQAGHVEQASKRPRPK